MSLVLLTPFDLALAALLVLLLVAMSWHLLAPAPGKSGAC